MHTTRLLGGGLPGHMFRSYCKGWEFEGQIPWCYINASCRAGGGEAGGTQQGSFGQPYEDCYETFPGEQPAGGSSSWSLPSPSPPPPPPVNAAVAVSPRLRPRSGCACSGYKNAHGFGAHCEGWEFAGQTPWCYVSPECHKARGGDEAAVQGSFGQPYEDCEEPPAAGRRLGPAPVPLPPRHPPRTRLRRPGRGR